MWGRAGPRRHPRCCRRCCRRRGRWRYSQRGTRRRRWSGSGCSTASDEIELADARGIGEAGGCVIVFVHMPEGHAVRRIDGGHAIIAPASEAVRLATIAGKHCSFALAEIIYRVSGKASGITNAWVDGTAGYGIANGRVTRVIDGYARHKAIQPVIAVCEGLLLHRVSWKIATCNIELI